MAARMTASHVIVTAPVRPGVLVVIRLLPTMTTMSAAVRREAIVRAVARTIGGAAPLVTSMNARGMAAPPPATATAHLVRAIQRIRTRLVDPLRAATMILMQTAMPVRMTRALAPLLGALEAL